MLSKTESSPALPKPTPTELNYLKMLWRLGAASAKEVHVAMLAEGHSMTEAAVLRQLQLMHSKGLLVRDEARRPHAYAPAQEQDAQQASLLKDMINKVFAGSGKALVLAALQRHVSADERAEISELLSQTTQTPLPEQVPGKGESK